MDTEPPCATVTEDSVLIFLKHLLTAGLENVCGVGIGVGWGNGGAIFHFPGDHSSIREPSSVVITRTCWGKYHTQLSTVLLEQSSQKYERGYGFIKRM